MNVDRPSLGSYGGAHAANCVSFVSQAGLHGDVGEKLDLANRLVAVRNTRAILKKDLILNDCQPQVRVDSQTREMRTDGELLQCEPVGEFASCAALFPVLKAGPSAKRASRSARRTSR